MSTLLKAHMDGVEQVLLAMSQIAGNTGHPVHKGTAREAFIKEFLLGHLSERVGIGNGEIIDANSKPNEKRNQIDIVLYKRDYPKINFATDIQGFLAESVVATIEIKSKLTFDELKMAVQAAHNVKSLQRNIITAFSDGFQSPSILSFVVAYDGPASMDTVYEWLAPIHNDLGINYPSMCMPSELHASVAIPSLDGIFVLGKGFILFDNTPLSFQEVANLRAKCPDGKWIFADIGSGNVLILFLLLTYAISEIAISRLDPTPYLPNLGRTTLWIGQ